jgi:hypothetical protein
MTTTLKQSILSLLKETQSVDRLVEYFRDNQLFDKFNTFEIPRYQPYYLYQIPVEVWEEITDIDREVVDFLPVVMDGAIYIDRYFDPDYKDYDSADRYVYLSIDNQFSN